MTTTEIHATPMDLLHIIEGKARNISLLAANPPQNLTPEDLLRSIASLWETADTLKGLWHSMNKDKSKGGAPSVSEAN